MFTQIPLASRGWLGQLILKRAAFSYCKCFTHSSGQGRGDCVNNTTFQKEKQWAVVPSDSPCSPLLDGTQIPVHVPNTYSLPSSPTIPPYYDLTSMAGLEGPKVNATHSKCIGLPGDQKECN